MSGVTYLACKPDVKTVNLTAGANISIFPSGPLSLAGSGNKLIQFTFIKQVKELLTRFILVN